MPGPFYIYIKLTPLLWSVLAALRLSLWKRPTSPDPYQHLLFFFNPTTLIKSCHFGYVCGTCEGYCLVSLWNPQEGIPKNYPDVINDYNRDTLKPGRRRNVTIWLNKDILKKI